MNTQEKGFQWLMEHLLPPQSDKFKGCEIIFPDTVFFVKAKPKLIIKTDKDFCLTAIRNPSKVNL